MVNQSTGTPVDWWVRVGRSLGSCRTIVDGSSAVRVWWPARIGREDARPNPESGADRRTSGHWGLKMAVTFRSARLTRVIFQVDHGTQFARTRLKKYDTRLCGDCSWCRTGMPGTTPSRVIADQAWRLIARTGTFGRPGPARRSHIEHAGPVRFKQRRPQLAEPPDLPPTT